MQSFQSLFSTLVQVIATLLSVLFAFISAYYVFLQDRATQYEDKIESGKLEIRNALLQIRSNWPWTLSLFVPPEFQDKYRAKYPEKSESDFVIQMITDLVFEAQEIRDALADAGASNSIEGHWQGRLYMLALTKAVTAITVGTPDSRTKPEKVFPSSADGMGYDQWRAQFNKIDQTIQLLSTFQASMREDYFLWASTRYNEKVARGEAERYQIALDGLFKRIQSVKDELREIDKQESLQKRYSFSQRIHEGLLLALIVLSIALGIGAPLVLLALPQWEMTSITAIVIIFLAGLSTLGAFIQFGWDVKKPVGVDYKEDIAKR